MSNPGNCQAGLKDRGTKVHPDGAETAKSQILVSPLRRSVSYERPALSRWPQAYTTSSYLGALVKHRWRTVSVQLQPFRQVRRSLFSRNLRGARQRRLTVTGQVHASGHRSVFTLRLQQLPYIEHEANVVAIPLAADIVNSTFGIDDAASAHVRFCPVTFKDLATIGDDLPVCLRALALPDAEHAAPPPSRTDHRNCFNFRPEFVCSQGASALLFRFGRDRPNQSVHRVAWNVALIDSEIEDSHAVCKCFAGNFAATALAIAPARFYELVAKALKK